MPRRVFFAFLVVLAAASPAWAKTKKKARPKATPTPVATATASASASPSPTPDGSPAPAAENPTPDETPPPAKNARSKAAKSRGDGNGDLSAEEKSVWHVVLLDAFPDATKNVAVVSNTAVDSNRGHHDLWKALRYLRIEMPELSESTTDDFEAANTAPHPVPKLTGAGKVEIVAWKTEALSMDEWHRFHGQHPKADALAILSRVGFSPDREQALAYVELACGDWCGGGKYYVLRATAEDHGWAVDRSYQSWDFRELWSAPPPPNEKTEKAATDVTKP